MLLKNRIASVIATIVLISMLTAGCVTTTESVLDVRMSGRYVYDTGTGETITASYYTLSDDSLNFVKLIMPDGDEHTLPQVVSASGARYSDDRELVWWTKGEGARVETRNEQGEWVPLYEKCTIVE